MPTYFEVLNTVVFEYLLLTIEFVMNKAKTQNLAKLLLKIVYHHASSNTTSMERCN